MMHVRAYASLNIVYKIVQWLLILLI